MFVPLFSNTFQFHLYLLCPFSAGHGRSKKEISEDRTEHTKRVSILNLEDGLCQHKVATENILST